MEPIREIEDQVTDSQSEDVNRLLRRWLNDHAGDVEKTVEWAIRNMPFGGRRFWRLAVNKAMESESPLS